jgi:hypothetical protein
LYLSATTLKLAKTETINMVKNEMYDETEKITGKFIPLIYTINVLDLENGEDYVLFPLLTFVTNEPPARSSDVFTNQGTIGLSSCPDSNLDDYSFMTQFLRATNQTTL